MASSEIQQILDLLRQGQAAEAISMLERRAREVPAHVTAHLLLALTYEEEGRLQEAAAAWRAAYFLMPNSPVVEAGRRRLLMNLHGGSPSAGSGRPQAVPAPVPPPEEDAFVDLTRPAAAPPSPAPEEEVLGNPNGAAAAEERAAEGQPHSGKRMGWETLPHVPESEEAPWQEASAEQEDALEEDFENLDRLIEELESARIVPGPDFESAPSPELDDEIEDVVSETLARIYAAQQQFDEAARVYELLAAQQPVRADEYLQKAAEMRARAAEE